MRISEFDGQCIMNASNFQRFIGDSKTRRLVLYFSALALAAGLLIFGTNAILKRVPVEERGPERRPLVPIGPAEAPADGGSRTRFVEPGAVDRRPVTYTPAGFNPMVVIIRSADAVGCLITVINRTVTPLRVGVNPHAVSGDPGADYGELAPNEVGLYDVRYPGFTEISLHAHARPEHGFRVVYGQGCL